MRRSTENHKEIKCIGSFSFTKKYFSTAIQKFHVLKNITSNNNSLKQHILHHSKNININKQRAFQTLAIVLAKINYRISLFLQKCSQRVYLYILVLVSKVILDCSRRQQNMSDLIILLTSSCVIKEDLLLRKAL